MRSVCTNPVFVQCLYKIISGVESETVSRCTNVCCLVITLFVQRGSEGFLSQNNRSKCYNSVQTPEVIA